MGRGVGLGCERCDFSATLYECQPFALDASGQPYALPSEGVGAPAGYWTDGLCGTCRMPVRVIRASPDALPVAGEGARCSQCGEPALTFEQAARELAEACHSRAWLDLRHEEVAVRCLETALGTVSRLRAAVTIGETTTLDALDELARELVPPANPTVALEDIGPLLENALDLDAAAQILRLRLQEGQGHIASLQMCADDEAQLPGVPCPQCQTGHLIHWPVWI